MSLLMLYDRIINSVMTDGRVAKIRPTA